MRKVTFGVGNSLDGYIARTDHAVDWLQWTKEIGEISATYWKTIDTVVMGRKTYEKSPSEGFPGVKNYVFSRTLSTKSSGAVQVVSTDAAKFVARMKKLFYASFFMRCKPEGVGCRIAKLVSNLQSHRMVGLPTVTHEITP